MKSKIGLLLLILGVGIAGAFSARNGAQHQDYREALWAASEGAPEEGRAAAQQVVDDVGLPTPSVRLNQWFSVGGMGWMGGIVLIVAGALLARSGEKASRQASAAQGAGAVSFPDHVAQLQAVVDRVLIQTQSTASDPIALAPLRATLDEARLTLVEPVVDARLPWMARHGVEAFAMYFSPFSAAERQMNRAWSALTDGHVPAAIEALQAAQLSLAGAAEAWPDEQAPIDRASPAK